MFSSISRTWREARRSPGFSLLYLFGVAFAIAFTMVYGIIYYAQIAPIYPEYNRPRTMMLQTLQLSDTAAHQMQTQAIGYEFMTDFMTDLDGVEHLGLIRMGWGDNVQPIDGTPDIPVKSNFVDTSFFKIFPYRFVAGRPFSEGEFESGMKVAVISDRLARRLYGSETDAIDKDISVSYEKCRVVGVVAEGTPLGAFSYGEVFAPYSSIEGFSKVSDSDRKYSGPYYAILTLEPGKDPAEVKAQLNERLTRANSSSEKWLLRVMQFDSHLGMVLAEEEEDMPNLDNEDSAVQIGPTAWDIWRPYLVALLVLLVMPAVNISGMISAQMDRRLSEMGVRRSFGATRGNLIRQVLLENFYMTLLGGIIGLIIAWVVVCVFQRWIFMLAMPSSTIWAVRDSSPEATVEMLFSPAIFISVLVICIILNLASAYLPVRWALRKNIVSYINEKL